MAEIAGLVIGGIGMATLFETCMSTFEYVDTGKNYGKDYQKAALKISILEYRLSRWGQQVEFREPPTGTKNAIVATAEQSKHVKRLLGQIQMDLEDAYKASQRYASPDPDRIYEEARGSGRLESLGDKFRNLSLKKQKRTSILAKTRWALRDKKKLEDLIEDITTGVDSLVKVLPTELQQSPQQRKAVTDDVQELVLPAEIEESDDLAAEDVIPVLQKITNGIDGQLHEAVNIAAAQVVAGTTINSIFTSKRARFQVGDYVEKGVVGQVPSAHEVTRVINNVNMTDKSRARFGNNYGGKDFMNDSDDSDD